MLRLIASERSERTIGSMKNLHLILESVKRLVVALFDRFQFF